jgi:hypothetical protein
MSSVQNILGICKQIVIHICYNVTLSELFNSVFDMILFFVPEMLTSFLSYIVHIVFFWIVFCSHFSSAGPCHSLGS